MHSVESGFNFIRFHTCVYIYVYFCAVIAVFYDVFIDTVHANWSPNYVHTVKTNLFHCVCVAVQWCM